MITRQFLRAVTAMSLVLFVAAPTVRAAKPISVIVVISRAADHHVMMEAARPFMESMAQKNKWNLEFTDDSAKINKTYLKKFQVFVMLQLAPFDMSYSQQAALQDFVEQGKGWVGIHAAGLTGKQFLGQGTRYWDWFENLMGNVIYSPHPAFQKGTVIIEDRKHPVTRHLPATMEVSDEWYEFDKSPRGNVHVLATADEKTYKQNKPMGDHPIVWTNERFRRAVYVGIGHSAETLKNPDYNTLVRDAITWAASK